MKGRIAGLTLCTLAGLLFAQQVSAEQTAATGAGPLSTNVRLDFRIVVPTILMFRVGGTGATNDKVAPIAGAGGDLGAVAAFVASNAGQVTIMENNNSAGNGLSDGAGNVISNAEIRETSSDPDLPTPDLSDVGGNFTLPVLNGGRVTYTASTP
jgi:hypothetical protein